METSTEIAHSPVDIKEPIECLEVTPMIEPAECLEVTPMIEPSDFLDGVASSLLADNTEQHPYTEQMLSDGLSYADIDYFVKHYSEIEAIKYEKVHCTVCNKHVGTAVETTERFPHPLLKVVTCENCYMFYCSGEFETDKDGSEMYCRWCGQGGQVFCCSKCPYVFCKKCIARNLGKNVAPQIECMEDWLCFNCNPCQISKLRAMSWALAKYSEEQKQIAETNPQCKSQHSTDFSSCCKSKRGASSKAAKEPAAKKAKTEKTKTPKNNSVEIVDTPPVWDHPVADAQDEVICTPDIMPFDDSPPGTPPEMPPIEYAPPPGQRGLDAPPNVPVVKKIVLPKLQPIAPKPVAKPAPKPAPKPTPKPAPKPAPKPNNTPVIKVSNQKSDTSKVVPTTQKITVPVQKGNVNSDEQWFGTAVIRSAEVTEYISGKVSLLAFMNSSDELTDEKKEEIYRTFQSHLDIAIAKLKNIKQNMTSSYKRLLSKQQIVLSGNTLKIVPASAVQAIQQQVQPVQKPPTPQPKPQPQPVQQPKVEPQSLLTQIPTKTIPARSSVRRRKSYSYIESTSEEENYEEDDDSSDDFMASRKKKKKRKTTTPKKTEPTPIKTPELVKIVDVSAIVKSGEPLKPIPTPMTKPVQNPAARIENNKIILDVIDLIDDDSNEAPEKKEKPEGEKEVEDIDSDVSELLPDHLVEESSQTSSQQNNQKSKKVIKQDGPIEIDDSDNDTSNDTKPKKDPETNDTEETKKDVDKTSSDEKKESTEKKDETKIVENEDSNLSKSEDSNNSSSVSKIKEKTVKVEEDSNLTNDENSQTSLKSKQDNDDSNLNENSNLSKKSDKVDDNSRSCDASESKSTQLQNDEMTDSITKSESEKVQNGECSNDSSKVPNDMSDNAVDNSENINKNGVDNKNKSPKIKEQDFEEILSGNVIKNMKNSGEKFEDEYSKFVSTSKSSFDDDLGEELDDALSLPPQNTLGFALGLKEKNKDNDTKDKKVINKNGNKKRNGSDGDVEAVENDLNVLRKLAENCLSSDVEANDSNA